MPMSVPVGMLATPLLALMALVEDGGLLVGKNVRDVGRRVGVGVGRAVGLVGRAVGRRDEGRAVGGCGGPGSVGLRVGDPTTVDGLAGGGLLLGEDAGPIVGDEKAFVVGKPVPPGTAGVGKVGTAKVGVIVGPPHMVGNVMTDGAGRGVGLALGFPHQQPCPQV